LNCAFVLSQFAKFRQLLKDAILLNDRLRKYTEKQLSLCAERSADHSDSLTVTDSVDLCRSDDANTSSECVASVLNQSPKDNADNSNERRIVRIVPASQNHQHHSLPSAPASQAAAESSSMINQQESVKIQVSVEYVWYVSFCLTGK